MTLVQGQEHGRIRDVLKQRLDSAQAEYRTRNAQFEAIVKQVPTGMPQPDGINRVQSAGRNHHISLGRYMKALKNFTDFIMHGTVPDDLLPPK